MLQNIRAITYRYSMQFCLLVNTSQIKPSKILKLYMFKTDLEKMPRRCEYSRHIARFVRKMQAG